MPELLNTHPKGVKALLNTPPSQHLFFGSIPFESFGYLRFSPREKVFVQIGITLSLGYMNTYKHRSVPIWTWNFTVFFSVAVVIGSIVAMLKRRENEGRWISIANSAFEIFSTCSLMGQREQLAGGSTEDASDI